MDEATDSNSLLISYVNDLREDMLFCKQVTISGVWKLKMCTCVVCGGGGSKIFLSGTINSWEPLI